MTPRDVANYLIDYDLTVIVKKDGTKVLRKPEGMPEDVRTKVLPFLRRFFGTVVDELTLTTSDSPDRLQMFKVEVIRETPIQKRERVYKNLLEFGSIMESRAGWYSSVDYSGGWVDLDKLRAMRSLPDKWSHVCLEKVTHEIKQWGGMLSSGGVRVEPIWTVIPVLVKVPEKTVYQKRYNPWKTESTYQNFLPPD